MRGLPCDERGFVVPWFAWHDEKGRPHISILDQEKWVEAVRRNRCWLCGLPLGVFKAFVVGPINVITRTVTEPPSHLDCAEYAMRVCPFLSSPAMRRRRPPERFVDEDCIVGHNGQRPAPNPGVFALWITRSYTLGRLRDKLVITIGDPVSVAWWTRGRLATVAEVEDARVIAQTQMCAHDARDIARFMEEERPA
jgi:hypothetical protein